MATQELPEVFQKTETKQITSLNSSSPFRLVVGGEVPLGYGFSLEGSLYKNLQTSNRVRDWEGQAMLTFSTDHVTFQSRALQVKPKASYGTNGFSGQVYVTPLEKQKKEFVGEKKETFQPVVDRHVTPMTSSETERTSYVLESRAVSETPESMTRYHPQDGVSVEAKIVQAAPPSGIEIPRHELKAPFWAVVLGLAALVVGLFVVRFKKNKNE